MGCGTSRDSSNAYASPPQLSGPSVNPGALLGAKRYLFSCMGSPWRHQPHTYIPCADVSGISQVSPDPGSGTTPGVKGEFISGGHGMLELTQRAASSACNHNLMDHVYSRWLNEALLAMCRHTAAIQEINDEQGNLGRPFSAAGVSLAKGMNQPRGLCSPSSACARMPMHSKAMHYACW